MSKMSIDKSGNQVWRNEAGQVHREDGPAIVGISGSQEWYLNGKRHRVDGPAITYTNGAQEWYLNGVLQPDHFGKKPNESTMTVDHYGRKVWQNEAGFWHREDGPAVIWADGSQYWYLNGKRHRVDGPAFIRNDGHQEWWLDGVQQPDHFGEKPNVSTMTVDHFGTRVWKNAAGLIHNEDGPAIFYADGRKEWWLNGMRHREDGPALICPDGSAAWYLNGKCHRIDGPAVIHADGHQEWWLDGVRQPDHFGKKPNESKMTVDHYGAKIWKNAVGQLHNEDGPAFISSDGRKEWWVNGMHHREDGPAVIHPNGMQAWWLNGKRHREDGPAITRKDGHEEWFLNGELHRVGGPAVIHANGSKGWFVNSKRHRVDGPAYISADGYQEWWLNNEQQPDHFGKKPSEKDTSIDAIIVLIEDLIKAEFAKKNATNIDQVYAKMQQLEKSIAILRSL